LFCNVWAINAPSKKTPWSRSLRSLLYYSAMSRISTLWVNKRLDPARSARSFMLSTLDYCQRPIACRGEN